MVFDLSTFIVSKIEKVEETSLRLKDEVGSIQGDVSDIKSRILHIERWLGRFLLALQLSLHISALILVGLVALRPDQAVEVVRLILGAVK